MRKQLALYATVAALSVAPALAQSNMQNQPSPQAQPSQPTTSQPSTMSPSATTQAPKAATGERFVNMQTSGQWLASDLVGMNVVGSKNETIGSVSDLLVDGRGNILAAVIGVGGFLGIGQKDVAISFTSLNITADKDGDPEARLTLTKEELESAPEFKTMADVKSNTQRPTTPATKPATPRN